MCSPLFERVVVNMFSKLIITLVAGLFGLYIGKKVNLPAYALIGAFIGVAFLNILTGEAYLPRATKPYVQIFAGILIGRKVTREELSGLRDSYKPIMISVGSILFYSLIMGFVIQRIGHLNYITSAFATAPGGLMDMALIGMDMGADMSVVTTMQMVRIISIVSLFPVFIDKFLKKTGNTRQISNKKVNYNEEKRKLKDVFCTVLVGGTSGLLGYSSGLPAMALIASMLGVALQNIVFKNAYLPKQVKNIVQLFAGIMIGQTITVESIESMKTLIVPTLLMGVVYISMTFLLGTLLYKTTNLDFPTALFACCPGGATDIVLICEEFGANSVVVSMIQYPRVFVVIAFYPMIIRFFV